MLQGHQGFLQGAGRAGDLLALLGAQGVDAGIHGLAGLDLVANAVQQGHHHRGEGQIAVAGRVGATELQALGLGAVAVHGDADGRGAVLGGVGQVYRGLVAGHQPPVGVGTGGGEGQHRGGVLEQPADGVQGQFAEARVLPAREQRLALFPERDVRVHAAAVVLENRLGHEGDRFAGPLGHVAGDVLEPHHLVAHLEQRAELHVDLGLPGGAHLVMMSLDLDAHLLHLVDHLAAEVVVGVGRADREVAALEGGLVAQVGLLEAGAVPGPFHRIDLVHAPGLGLLVTDLVKDEELQLRPDEAGVGDAGALEIPDGLLGHVARVLAVLLAADRVEDVGQDADRGLLEEAVQAGGFHLGDGQHVRHVDLLPAADARPVEAQALLEGPLIELVHGVGTVLPGAQHVAELQVHHLGPDLLAVVEKIPGSSRTVRHRGVMNSRHGESSLSKTHAEAEVPLRAAEARPGPAAGDGSPFGRHSGVQS